MAVNIQNTFPQSRNVAQGETFVIYFRILPSEIDSRIDEVYAQTDDGIESNHLLEPMFGKTMNVFFDAEATNSMTTGDHHVRVWAIEGEHKYVLFETKIQVNPAFPFTEDSTDIDYTYRSNLKKDVESKIVNVQVGSSNIQSVQTYPNYRGKIDSPWLFNEGVSIDTVESEDKKPLTAKIGDLVIVESGEEGVEDYLYVCIKEDPAEWRLIGYRTFRGSYSGLVPESTEETQDMYLKGDGTWGKVGKESLQEDDFILNNDVVDISCDF